MSLSLSHHKTLVYAYTLTTVFLSFVFQISKYKNPSYYYWFFTQQTLDCSHHFDTLYTIICFKMYNTKTTNYCHWNFFRRNYRPPLPSRYSRTLVFNIWTFTIWKIQVINIKIFTSQALGHAHPLRTLSLKFRISICIMQKI